jgi:hypothetical protein
MKEQRNNDVYNHPQSEEEIKDGLQPKSKSQRKYSGNGHST